MENLVERAVIEVPCRGDERQDNNYSIFPLDKNDAYGAFGLVMGAALVLTYIENRVMRGKQKIFPRAVGF